MRQQTPTVRGLHARRTGKSTKNIGKLLQEAAGLRARCAMILESGENATLKNLETGVQVAMPIAAAIAQLRG